MVWLVVQAGVADYDSDEQSPPATPSGPVTSIKKKWMSDIISFQTTSANPPPPQRLLSMYDSPKARHKKESPLFTMSIVRQAYAVYPYRPELIEPSSLIKVIGKNQEGKWSRKEDAFTLILPDEGSAGMLKWIVALRDAFELYGRPTAWNWNHRDPVSLLFGYPAEQQKAELFLDRAIAETIDPREARLTEYYPSFKALLKALLKKHRFPSQ